MPKLFIDNREVEVEAGRSVLEAAASVGIRIPTLCHLPGKPPQTSCMVCLVKVKGSGRMVPSCGLAAEDGLQIESETPEVHAARRAALELLLGDHLGDCVAPCQAVCPAAMDVPRMIRQIARGDMKGAIATVRRDLALPAVLARICPAPCEHGCRRGAHDAPIAICRLQRFVADADLASGSPHLPPRKPSTGKRVAVVGAGPCGLAAAHHLLQAGHACVLFDEHAMPGGMLRYGVPRERLPESVVDAELAVLAGLGAEFWLGRRIEDDEARRLQNEFDSVLLAAGAIEETLAAQFGLKASEHGVDIDHHTHQTSLPGVFAGGGAVRKQKLAVRAVADGKAAAESICQFLAGLPVTGPRRPFTTHIGRVHEGEMERFLAADSGLLPDAGAGGAISRAARVEPAAGTDGGFTQLEAHAESLRCLHCDCRRAADCRLRLESDEYHASPVRYKGTRRLFEQIAEHPEILYEPGKCIACGLCIAAAREACERLGLTFIGRGFDVRVAVPFGETLAAGLETAGRKCAAVCPTGAMALRTPSEPGASDEQM